MVRILAVAHQTAESVEFVQAVTKAAARDPGAEFVVLVPATHPKHMATWTEGEAKAIAADKAEAVRRRLEKAGVTVADARVGDAHAYEAIIDQLNAESFDEIIVSTFQPGISRWLGADLITRIQRSRDIPVTHVIAH